MKRCGSFRPGRLGSPTAVAKYTLRSLASRYRQLSKEIQDLKAELERLIQEMAPVLVEARILRFTAFPAGAGKVLQISRVYKLDESRPVLGEAALLDVGSQW